MDFFCNRIIFSFPVYPHLNRHNIDSSVVGFQQMFMWDPHSPKTVTAVSNICNVLWVFLCSGGQVCSLTCTEQQQDLHAQILVVGHLQPDKLIADFQHLLALVAHEGQLHTLPEWGRRRKWREGERKRERECSRGRDRQ